MTETQTFDTLSPKEKYRVTINQSLDSANKKAEEFLKSKKILNDAYEKFFNDLAQWCSPAPWAGAVTAGGAPLYLFLNFFQESPSHRNAAMNQMKSSRGTTIVMIRVLISSPRCMNIPTI